MLILNTAQELYAYGTSEGAEKGWDERGRGRKEEPKKMYYVEPEVKAIEDYNTKQVTVKGLLGTAPDGETVIEYPVRIYESGYWNKGKVREVMRDVKQRLIAEATAKGFPKSVWTKPLKMSTFWDKG